MSGWGGIFMYGSVQKTRKAWIPDGFLDFYGFWQTVKNGSLEPIAKSGI